MNILSRLIDLLTPHRNTELCGPPVPRRACVECGNAATLDAALLCARCGGRTCRVVHRTVDADGRVAFRECGASKLPDAPCCARTVCKQRVADRWTEENRRRA